MRAPVAAQVCDWLALLPKSLSWTVSAKKRSSFRCGLYVDQAMLPKCGENLVDHCSGLSIDGSTSTGRGNGRAPASDHLLSVHDQL
jgi:hypothetical protein